MNLHELGWNERTASLFAVFSGEGLRPARVVRADRGEVTVDGEGGPQRAVLAGRLHRDGLGGPPAVGDWVGLDVDGGSVVVRAILPRISALCRRRPGAADHEQVAAANVDLVLIAESPERGPNPRRIERAAALAWDAGAVPVVVITKIDLCENVEAAQARARQGAPFAEILAVSATSGSGVEPLRAMLAAGATAVLLGPSGVGKSTLANLLLGEARFKVGEVRSIDHRGRHTTSHRELVVVPGGGCLIDTPGVREIGLWLEAEAVQAAFPEIEEASADCRFRDCRHESEPGCAVLVAMEEGRIDSDRLASFHRLRREAENLELRRDQSRRHEVKARERAFGKMTREVMRLKNKR